MQRKAGGTSLPGSTPEEKLGSLGIAPGKKIDIRKLGNYANLHGIEITLFFEEDLARTRTLEAVRQEYCHFPEYERPYVDVNTLGHMPWAYRMPVSQMPITDAKSLLPFGLEAGLNKQIMIRLAVPKNAMPGVYTGKILFRSGSSGPATVTASVPLDGVKSSGRFVEDQQFWLESHDRGQR